MTHVAVTFVAIGALAEKLDNKTHCANCNKE